MLTTLKLYRFYIREIIKSTQRHNFILDQIHVDKFHNTKSNIALISIFIFDYKNKQYRIVINNKDNIKEKKYNLDSIKRKKYYKSIKTQY